MGKGEETDTEREADRPTIRYGAGEKQTDRQRGDGTSHRQQGRCRQRDRDAQQRVGERARDKVERER